MVKWRWRGYVVKCSIVVVGRLMENWMVQNDFTTIAHVVILTVINGIHIYRGIRDTVAPVGRRRSLSRSTDLAIRVLVKLRCRVEVPAQPINAITGENTKHATLMLIEIYPEGLVLVTCTSGR